MGWTPDRRPVYHLEETREFLCVSVKPISTQCVDVTAPVILVPTAAMGSPTVTCQGSPKITCATNADGTMCTVTLTQQVCVSIPVRYGVTMSTCDPTISCADSCTGCGCC